MRKLGIAALTLGILLMMGGLRAADLRWSRDETLKSAELRAVDLAQVIAAYLGETFAAGDASLRQLALHSRRVGGPGAPQADWSPSLASARAGLTSIGAISVVNRDGFIRHSTRSEIVGQLRASDYVFQRSISASGDDLVVGTPYPTIEVPPQLVIPIGRRLIAANGTLDGVVVASFRPAAPRGFFRAVDVGERGTVWVFHPDAVVLFREPSADKATGESATANPIFTAALRRGGSGVLTGPIDSGGPVLLSAFHTSTTPPVIVAVSLDRDEVLAEWRHEATSSAWLFAALAMIFAGTLLVLFRQMDAKANAELALMRERQLEAERLREANDRLASALEREQIVRRDAEAASALKDQFLMTISHELRTPLTAIYGWARMLNEGVLADRQKQAALKTIERNARAQTRLIDDLLDVSRVMGGKFRLDVRQVNVADVVNNAVETVGPAADAKNIRLEVGIEHRMGGRVSGDPERLQQVVWNLLSNAVKFTPPGGRVRMTVSRTDREIEIAVSDTGIGISQDFLPHVFERFRQQDGGTTRRYGGLGLGLAIVRNLVELHGGSVSAHSDGEGRGATFTVRLPAAATSPFSAKQTPMPATPTATAAASPAMRLDGVRVLVVDDDQAARDLFAAILETAGATVTCATSAEHALTLLRSGTYDVILSDIEMPEQDGYGLIHKVLAIARGRGERLMAIAITAYSRPDDEARSLAAGFHRHMQKPIDPARLIAVVRSLVDNNTDDEEDIRDHGAV